MAMKSGFRRRGRGRGRSFEVEEMGRGKLVVWVYCLERGLV